MVRMFWILMIVWCILRAGLLTLAWVGDGDPVRRAQVLRFFTEEDIAKGQEYLRQGFAAKVASAYVQIGVLAWLFWAGWFTRAAAVLQRWTGEERIWLFNLLFLLLFFAIQDLLRLPFQFYLGYVCEKQMGFSTVTLAGWFFRWGKSLAVGWFLGVAGTLLLLWVIKTFERSWPIVMPVVGTVFSMVTILLAPLVITPLFYDQKPVAAGPLRDRILQIAAQAGVPVEDVYEIDESRYSTHTNAYFTGLFGKRRIVLYDTLIKSHTVDEAALIFAHEVGHWIHDHMRIGLTLGFFGMLGGSVFLWWCFPSLQREPAFGLGPLWSAVNLPFFLLVGTTLNVLGAPIEAQISQHFERQADRASLELTSLSQTFIEAEIRLTRDNKAHPLPHPWRVAWLFSHPPAIDRIAMALAFEEERKAKVP